jgi:hypothetical protein
MAAALGEAFTIKNTFLHIPSELTQSAWRCRRNSAPELTYREEFSSEASQSNPMSLPDGMQEVSSMASPSDNVGNELSNNDEVVTLMLKNIPCSCKKWEVVAAIDQSGFMKLANFFYMPMRQSKIIGYAFIGFPSAEITKEFAKAMAGYRFPNKRSAKTMSVVPASVQGFDNNVEYFRGRSVMDSDDKPHFREQMVLEPQLCKQDS